MISRTTLETMKVICNKKDECLNKGCFHYGQHAHRYDCTWERCSDGDKQRTDTECIQADPIRFELIS